VIKLSELQIKAEEKASLVQANRGKIFDSENRRKNSQKDVIYFHSACYLFHAASSLAVESRRLCGRLLL